MVERSFVIPVLSLGEGDRYNIEILLRDLETIPGEVVCIFNSEDAFNRLKHHPRIDKYAYNKTNAGVSRSWNMGINLSEARTVFMLNSDLHVEPAAIAQLEHYLYQLPKAVLVGPQGAYVDFTHMRIIQYFKKGTFDAPIRTHDVSGFMFAIHMQRFIEHKLSFDVRYSPCFMEEWDMGIQVMKAGLACYTVPVTAFEHEWGVSGGCDDIPIQYFGKTVYRNTLLRSNRYKFQQKWFEEVTSDYPACIHKRERGELQRRIDLYAKKGMHGPASQCRIDLDSGFDHQKPTCKGLTTGIWQKNARHQPLYLAMDRDNVHGWKVCSHYLRHELSRLIPVEDLGQKERKGACRHLKGKVIHALTDSEFFPLYENALGEENYGYTFFERWLSERSVENAKRFDLVLAGSTWCRDLMLEMNIKNCDVLIQGIDTDLFHAMPSSRRDDRFLIFSGGKFELRKSQDLVLKAVSVIQERHHDVWLVNCWFNSWPASIRTMERSPHISFSHRRDLSWRENMRRLYVENGLDENRIFTLEMVAHSELPQIYSHTDVGVFPNRCEGGTNLVLMEYMACGKPVIATNCSGHRDVLTSQNALCLNNLRELRIASDLGEEIAVWHEPTIDDLVDQLEYAYSNRDAIRKLGLNAAEDLKKMTWASTAKRLLKLIGA